jgi:hypothetical protein
MFGEKKNNIYNVNDDDDDGGFHITIIIITKQINNNREKYILPTCCLTHLHFTYSWFQT